MADVLVTHALSKTYRKGHVTINAVQDVTLAIPDGAFMVIMGKSGSGKTSLLQLLGGLARPSAGEILYREHAITAYSSKELALFRRREVGFVFQEYNLLPTLTALENVMLPLKYLRVPSDERHERAQAILEQVGLGKRLRHYPSELSGGEQQRVAVARALVHRPGMIMGDEITGSIDSVSAQELIDYLSKLHREQHQTIVIATHDHELAKVATIVMHLSDGRLLQ
jgi:putative ABC transport system ATP-binding protein